LCVSSFDKTLIIMKSINFFRKRIIAALMLPLLLIGCNPVIEPKEEEVTLFRTWAVKAVDYWDYMLIDTIHFANEGRTMGFFTFNKDSTLTTNYFLDYNVRVGSIDSVITLPFIYEGNILTMKISDEEKEENQQGWQNPFEIKKLTINELTLLVRHKVWACCSGNGAGWYQIIGDFIYTCQRDDNLQLPVDTTSVSAAASPYFVLPKNINRSLLPPNINS